LSHFFPLRLRAAVKNHFSPRSRYQFSVIRLEHCSLCHRWNHARERISHQEYDDTHQRRKDYAVQENMAQNASFVALLAGGDTGNKEWVQ
jgi:hypothetical protein